MIFGKRPKSPKESPITQKKTTAVLKPGAALRSPSKPAIRQASNPLPSINSVLSQNVQHTTQVAGTVSYDSNENVAIASTKSDEGSRSPKQPMYGPPRPRPPPKPLGPPNWTVEPGGLTVLIDNSIEVAQDCADEIQMRNAHKHDGTHIRQIYAKHLDPRQKEKHTLYPKSQASSNSLFDFHRYAHSLADFIDLEEEKVSYNVLTLFSSRPRKLRGEWEDYFTLHADSDHESRFLRLQAYMKALESFCYLGNEYLTDQNTTAKKNSLHPLMRKKTDELCCWVETMVKDAYFARRTLFALEHLYQDYPISKLGLTRAVNEDVLPKLSQFRQHHDELRATYKVTATERTKTILQKVAFKILRLTVEAMGNVEDIADYTFYESCQHAIKNLHHCHDPISRKRALMVQILDQPNVTRRHTDPQWASAFKDVLSDLDALKTDPQYSLVSMAEIDAMDIFKPRSNAKRKLSTMSKASSSSQTTIKPSSIKSSPLHKLNRVKFAIGGQILTTKEENQGKFNTQYHEPIKLQIDTKSQPSPMDVDCPSPKSRPLIVGPLTVRKTSPKKMDIC